MSNSNAPSRIGFVGLGVMGFPMAGHLAAKGHRMTVYNRSAHKAVAWVGQHGGATASTPVEAAAGMDYVMTCVGGDEDLYELLLGPQGMLGAMRPGAVLIDHTTASAAAARRLFAASKEKGIGFLDAPVSGGQTGAQAGKLTVMIGGDEPVFDGAESVMKAYAQAVTYMGPSGAGQLTKMVNQICVAGVVQALAEGLVFAQRAGLDANRVMGVISKGAAQSWQLDHRSSTMLKKEFDFGFAVDLMHKDLGICLSEAQRNGSSLPVTALVCALYAQLRQRGCGSLDLSSLILLLQGSRD